MFPWNLSPSSPNSASSPSGIGVGRHQWHKKLRGHAVADVSEATGRNLIDHGQRIHVEFQGHLLRWKKVLFFFYKFTVVKSSSNPGDYEAFKLNLADWNRSNQPHYPSPGDDFSFSKISWVSAVGLWPGPTGLYSLSLCCVSVPLSGSHQSLMSRNKANTKAYCTLEKPWSEKRSNLEIPEDICRMR